MTTIAIIPEHPGSSTTTYRAVGNAAQSVGQTPGQALDAIAAQGALDGTTLVVIQAGQPDAFFTAAQQQRLAVLMAQWRAARDAGGTLSAADQAELDALVDAEVRGAGQRAAALAQRLGT